MPEVSVIMGVNNGGRFLPATLASVFAQTFADWELVVVDNGSTDGGLAAALGPRPDPRVRTFTFREALSPGGALAVACREARGRYLAVLDADDLAHPRRLELQHAYLELRPEVGLLGAASDLIDKEGRPLGREPFVGLHEDIRALLAYVHVLRHSSVMFRRELAEQAPYRASIGVGSDHDFFARAAELVRVEALPAPLCSYRLHGDNRSLQSPNCATSRALVCLLARRRRDDLPEDLPVWEARFRSLEVRAAGHTGRAYLACARLFADLGYDDLAALNAWQAMREGAPLAGAFCYLPLTAQSLLRSRSTVLATARAWLKEPAHQLLRAAGAPDRPQF